MTGRPWTPLVALPAGVFCSDENDYPTSMPPGSFFCFAELDTSLNRNNSGAHEERTHIVEDLACTRHRRCMQRSQPIVQSNYLHIPIAHSAHSLAAISEEHHPITTIQSQRRPQQQATIPQERPAQQGIPVAARRDRGSRQPDV